MQGRYKGKKVKIQVCPSCTCSLWRDTLQNDALTTELQKAQAVVEALKKRLAVYEVVQPPLTTTSTSHYNYSTPPLPLCQGEATSGVHPTLHVNSYPLSLYPFIPFLPLSLAHLLSSLQFLFINSTLNVLLSHSIVLDKLLTHPFLPQRS